MGPPNDNPARKEEKEKKNMGLAPGGEAGKRGGERNIQLDERR